MQLFRSKSGSKIDAPNISVSNKSKNSNNNNSNLKNLTTTITAVVTVRIPEPHLRLAATAATKGASEATAEAFLLVMLLRDPLHLDLQPPLQFLVLI